MGRIRLRGPHSIDRFATRESCQALSPPFAGRFCSLFFHPEAVWTDAFSAPWVGEMNWAFPPFPFAGDALSMFLTSGAAGSLVLPRTPAAADEPLRRMGPGDHGGDVVVARTGRALSHISARA